MRSRQSKGNGNNPLREVVGEGAKLAGEGHGNKGLKGLELRYCRQWGRQIYYAECVDVSGIINSFSQLVPLNSVVLGTFDPSDSLMHPVTFLNWVDRCRSRFARKPISEWLSSRPHEATQLCIYP